jgi:hypothetical protein
MQYPGVKWVLPLLVVLVLPAPASAAAVGDRYDQVVAEKGPPAGVLAAGAVQVLTYPDAVIKVRDGLVVSIRVPDKDRPYVPTPAPTRQPGPTPVPGYGAPVAWRLDLRAAMAVARARKSRLLLLFTASDGSADSTKMDEEVFSQPEFAAYANQKFVLVKLDYPSQGPQPDEVRLTNRRIANHYQVKGFPAVVLLDPAGAVLTRFEGYRPGGAADFIAWARTFEPDPGHP